MLSTDHWSLDIGGYEPLDYDHVAPHAIQPPVLLVDAHLTEAGRAHQRLARLVIGEDAGYQLPESSYFSGLDKSFDSQAASAPPTRLAAHVYRALGDARVALAWAV